MEILYFSFSTDDRWYGCPSGGRNEDVTIPDDIPVSANLCVKHVYFLLYNLKFWVK